MADITNKQLIDISSNFNADTKGDLQAGLTGLGKKMSPQERENTGYNTLSSEVNLDNYDGQALMDFFKKLFGLDKDNENSSSLTGTYEELSAALDESRGVINAGENIIEGLSKDPVEATEDNKLLGYKEKFEDLTKGTALEGFDSSKIKFKEEDGKFKVVLPKDLYAAYKNLGQEGQDDIVNGLKGYISQQKSSQDLQGGNVGVGEKNPTEEVPDNRSLMEKVDDVKTFSELKDLRNSNKDDLAILGRREREALKDNRSFSIAGEERNYNRYKAESAKEGTENGHYNQQIGGQNKLIQMWSDKHSELEGVDLLASELNDNKFGKIDIEDKTSGIGKLCAENKGLEELVGERNRLVGLREARIEKCDAIADNSLEYAKAKTTEQHHQSGYDKGRKSLESAVIDQGNLAHHFGFSKHKDRLHSVYGELENLAPDVNNRMTSQGLKDAIETAYANMTPENKVSMHKVDIFKVKLDENMLSGENGKAGAVVLMYAQNMPKVFSAMLSEKVGNEINGDNPSNTIFDSLDTMISHSDDLKAAKVNREEVRGQDGFKKRENIVTRAAESISDSVAEFSSGVSNNSKIGVQKTADAAISTVESINDGLAAAVKATGEAWDRAAEQYNEKSGNKFHENVKSEREQLLESLKGDKKGKADEETVQTGSLSKESSLESFSGIAEVMEDLKKNKNMKTDNSPEMQEGTKGKGNSR